MNRTWPSIQEMHRGMTLVLQGNPHFMWQRENNKYYPCRDLEQLRRSEQDIFDGLKTPGFFPIRPGDNLTRCGAVDLDNHDGRFPRFHWRDDARRVFDRLAERFKEAWLEESSPDSFHVRGFQPELIPARDMRQILRECVPDHPSTNIEIYPKQDELVSGKRMGNCLRFPGYHQFRHCWSKIITVHGRIDDVNAPSVKVTKWEASSRGAQFLSLYAQVTRGIRVTGKGQRFNPIKTIVGRLKGRTFDEEIARAIHDRFYRENEVHFTTPIEQSRACFMTWFRKAKPCNLEIPDYPLTQTQQAKLDALPSMLNIRPDALAETVRLFLNAKRYADKKGREFCMSLPYLARRLGVSSYATASKYRNACYRIGLIEMVKRGSYVRGRASTYRLGTEWEK